MANKTPTIQPWAMNALRELIDIASLLNDEMFISMEAMDARSAIVQRLQALAEGLTLDTGEPHIEESDGSDY
ncbi:MAG: hypothetical protein ACHWZW_23015 [Spirulina sp.]